MQQKKKYGFPENVCFSNFAECPMTINGINLRHDEDYLLLCWCKATSKPLKFIKKQSSCRSVPTPSPVTSLLNADLQRPRNQFYILPQSDFNKKPLCIYNTRTRKFILKHNLFLVASLLSCWMSISGFQGLSLSFVLSTCLLSTFPFILSQPIMQ